MADFLSELQDKLGTAVTADPQICRVYDHDLGEMPAILLSLFKRTPTAVVLPKTCDDVHHALAIAYAHKVPITPRAQASSGYGGTMPTKGGLVVDLSRLRSIVEIDQEKLTCTVEAGVVWADLEAALNKVGLALCICPTSGPSSTVGGLFAMGGMGIGSMRYGSILDVVTKIEVVDPDGSFRQVEGSELETYAFSQGTLGIITKLTLNVRKAAQILPYAIHAPNAKAAELLMQSLFLLNPYSVSAVSAEYLDMQSRSAKHPYLPPIESGLLVLAVFTGDELIPDFDPWLNKVISSSGCRLLAPEVGQHEWEARFYPMRIKRNAPALLVGEYLVDLKYFSDVFNEVSAKLKYDVVGFEGFVNRERKVSVLVYVQDSAEDLLSLVRMGKAMVPLHIASKFGGCVYASGLWFNASTRSILGDSRTKRLLARKHDLDPLMLMNPGKCCGHGLTHLPFALLSKAIWLGTKLITPLSCFFRAKPRTLAPKGE
ncbi:MAG: FAD-binding oxidoreductase [Desulfovibrionaceae bacterium]|nr:FAD-binding oxidoreductase [Desulfovibrionaceae bacterium]